MWVRKFIRVLENEFAYLYSISDGSQHVRVENKGAKEETYLQCEIVNIFSLAFAVVGNFFVIIYL